MLFLKNLKENLMNNTKNYGYVLGVLMAVAGSADAAITAPVIVDFGTKPDRGPDTVLPLSVNGFANIDSVIPSDNACVGTSCVYQNGMVVGTVTDPLGSHLHPGGSIGATSNRNVSYENDSSGMYFRTADLTSFSFDKIYIDAHYDANKNPYTPNGSEYYDPALDYFEIRGFSDAINVGIGSAASFSNQVAYQTVQNGFVGDLTINDQFKDVKAVWIHYAGFPNVASIQAAGMTFYTVFDDIHVSSAAPVPVPAAVWLFGSGLIGLLSLGRKKAVQA